jgi:hypothetical protein
MFTTPDQTDAVATPPTFQPPGPRPQGFYADCNPATNFPGTRPVADDFNELIVNLHNLLVEAGIPGVKGDPTMLTRGLRAARIIRTSQTLQVAPTGTATPVNPWGGDPFATLGQALAYLRFYRITGGVTITIAAGTYAEGALQIYHPDGGKIIIQGAGPASTILHFTGTSGMTIYSLLANLRQLTLRGDGAAGMVGLSLSSAGVNVDTITVDGFESGVAVNHGWLNGNGPLTITNCPKYGLWVSHSLASFVANCAVTVQASGTASPALAAVVVSGCSEAQFLAGFTITGGQRCLLVYGNSNCALTTINLSGCSTPANALTAYGGPYVGAYQVTPNAWTFASGHGIHCAQNGFIVGNGAIPAGTPVSPALDTLGNQGGFITNGAGAVLAMPAPPLELPVVG